jgi:comEA protein
MEGNVMKFYLSMMVLVAVVTLTSLSPVDAFATDNPAVNSITETIQLNQATAEQLQALPGVGPALSERIVVYRTEHGPFKSLEQLTEVKGVGQAKLAKFKNQLILN